MKLAVDKLQSIEGDNILDAKEGCEVVLRSPAKVVRDGYAEAGSQGNDHTGVVGRSDFFQRPRSSNDLR